MGREGYGFIKLFRGISELDTLKEFSIQIPAYV